jgi:hypothetical protein
MNKFFNDLQKEARAITLSPKEKQSMRVQVYAMMEVPRAVPSTYRWFSPRFSVPIAALLLIGLTSGTAFAAQSALPGDPLYAIKVNVTEPVQGALATTPKAKAEWHVQVAETRLEEGEALAASGKLTATTSAALATNFDAHAAAAQTIAANLAQQDPGSAAELTTTFDSALSAQGAILTQLGNDSPTTTVKESSDTLAAHVLAQDQQAGEDSAALAVASTTATIASTTPPSDALSSGVSGESASTTSPNPDVSVVVSVLQTEASSTLAAAEADFTALEPSLDASTSVQIQAQITAAQNLIEQGNAALGAGDNSAAKDAFTRAVHTSVRLDAFLGAGKKFNAKFLSSLLTSTGFAAHKKGEGTATTTEMQSSLEINQTINSTSASSSSTSSEGF